MVAIYSPQLGNDIKQSFDSLGQLFAPPSTSDLLAKQQIASQQATIANQQLTQAAQAKARDNIAKGLATPADYITLGVQSPVQQYGLADMYNFVKTHPGVAPPTLDAGRYALGASAGDTFAGQAMKPLSSDQSMSMPPAIASALGLPNIVHGVIGLGDNSKMLPGSGQQPIVTAPDSGNDDSRKWGILGEDQFGNKIYGYPPKLSTVPDSGTPMQNAPTAPAGPTAPAVAPASGQQPAPAASPSAPQPALLHGSAFLQTLDPGMAGQVQAVIEGRAPYPTGMLLKTPYGQKLATYVTQADPSFETGNAMARMRTRNEFTSGGPNSPAGAITAGNTAIQHLGAMSDLAETLGNADTGIPGNNLYNTVKNTVATSAGGGVPVTRFNNALNAFTEEATKFYRGTGGNESDIQRGLANLNPNQSPSQLRAAIQQQAQLMGSKINALQDRWHQAMGPGAGDFQIIHPEAQAALDRINSRVAPTQTSSVAAGPGGSNATATPNGAQPVQPPPAAAGAPAAPSAVPAPSPGGDPLAMARAAIARGAPRAAVIQRLQQNGIDPTGL